MAAEAQGWLAEELSKKDDQDRISPHTSPALDRLLFEEDAWLMRRAVSKRKVGVGFGIPLGLLLVLAIVVPGLTQEAAEELGDTGREMALSAGCDMSKNEISMVDTQIDYLAGYGSPSVEAAVVRFSIYLKEIGVSASEDTLREAAAKARKDTDPIEVRLPGLSLQVRRNGDAYVVGWLVHCA